MINKKHILILCFITFAYSININPFVLISYNTDSELYRDSNSAVGLLLLGSDFKYQNGNIFVESQIAYYLYDAYYQRPDDFNSMEGVGKIENSPGLSDNQFNYFESTVSLNYKIPKINLYTNLSSPQWGLGVSKIIISGKAPPFFNMGYIWEITPKIKYEHMYGKLVSMIEDESYNEDVYTYDQRYAQYKRNMAAHRLTYNMSDKINLYLYEIVVYGGNRDIEPYYMLPLVPFLPIQTQLGDLDNDIISFEAEYVFNSNMRTYFGLSIDEWSPSYTFDKEHKNWFIYQFGFLRENIFFNNDIFQIEYTHSDPRVYRHRFNINDYYSYDYPLGFWAGPHAEHFLLEYTNQTSLFDINFIYSFSKRGHLTEEMRERQYNYSDNFYIDRYSDGFESKNSFAVTISNISFKKINIDIGYRYVLWDNPLFVLNEVQENYTENETVKNDLYFRFKYQF